MGDKALDIHTYAALQEVGERLNFDKKKFALDVLDRCIDPNSKYAVQNEQNGCMEGGEMRTFDAAVSLLRNENREDAAVRIDQLRVKLLKCQLCEPPTTAPGTVCHKGLTYNVSTKALQGMLFILSTLHKKGGHTSDAHETVMSRLGVPASSKPPLKLESWRPFGAVLRDIHVHPTGCFQPTNIAPGILNKIAPTHHETPQKPVHRLPQVKAAQDVPNWASWLVPARNTHTPFNGYSDTDRQTAALFLSHAPSQKTEVTSEHIVISAALDCVAGKETELFMRKGGVWQMQMHGNKKITIPGWTHGAFQNVLQPVFEVADLQSIISNACTEGINHQESGPTLPLFCTKLSRLLHTWHEELLWARPKLLLGLKRKLQPMLSKLRTVAKLLRPTGEQTFPLGSVLLQAIYRELQRTLAVDDEHGARLFLPLLNETMQPLLHAVSNYMHGMNPGVWLETEGSLVWEKLPMPKFLNTIEGHAASTGGTIKDIRYIHPGHIVLQQLDRAALPAVDPLGFERRRGGVNGILGAVANSAPPVLPIAKGILLSVFGAVEIADAIAKVRSARQVRVEQAAQQVADRQEKQLLQSLQFSKSCEIRHISIPSDWPGTQAYRKAQVAAVAEKVKKDAEKAALELQQQIASKEEQKAKEKEQNLEAERATLLPKFTDEEIQAARKQVEAEYAKKMEALDAGKASEKKGRAESQASSVAMEDLVDSCSELGPPPTESSDEMGPPPTESSDEMGPPPTESSVDMETAEDSDSGEDQQTVDHNKVTSIAHQLPLTVSEPKELNSALHAVDKEALKKGDEKAKSVSLKRVPQGQVQTVNIYNWEETAPAAPKRYRARKVTAEDLKMKRVLKATGGPKRKRKVVDKSGRGTKQRCVSQVVTSFGVGHDRIVSGKKIILPMTKPKTPVVEPDVEEDVYQKPAFEEQDVFARAKALTKLKQSVPMPTMVSAPPKSIAEQLTKPVSVQRSREKEHEESFTSVERLKALYKTVKERSEGRAAVEDASPLTKVTEAVTSKDTKWVLEVLTSNWTGNAPRQPEDLPVTVRSFRLPLSVAIDCTLKRAVEAQRCDVDEAIQEAMLSKARLSDTLAVLHTVYLAMDSFLSSEIAYLVDEAAARRATPVNTKGRISLALHQMRTEVASNNRHFDSSEFVKLFTVDVQSDIGTASGGLAARAGRNEYAEDYIQITYAPPESLRHIVTDNHLQVYQKVHRLMLALRSAVRVSTGVLRKCARVRCSASSVVALCVLRYEVQRMLQGVLTYLSDGMRAATSRLSAVLTDTKHPMHPTSVPGYRSMHSVFVEGLQRYTMLTSSFKPQYKKLRDLIRIALELPSIALVSPPSMSAVQSLRSQFTETRQYIIDSLVSMLYSTDEDTVSPVVTQYNIANWPKRSQWAKELLARIDPVGAARASNLP